MLALMNPSNVATRSSTRGTSRGVTVVTRTSGAVGSGGAGFREQLIASDTQITSPAITIDRFTSLLLLIAIRSVERRFGRDQRRLFCSLSNPRQPIVELLHIAQSDYLRDVPPEEQIERPGNYDSQLFGQTRQLQQINRSPKPPCDETGKLHSEYHGHASVMTNSCQQSERFESKRL